MELAQSATAPRPLPRPLNVLVLVQNFHLGGAEGQAVELLRTLPPDIRTSLACLDLKGAHLDEVRDLGFDPLELRLEGSLLQPNTGRQVWRLAQEIRSRGVKVVHTHDYYTTLLGVPAARLAGAKVIVGRLDLGHWPLGLRKALLKAATRAADAVVANAKAIRAYLVHSESVVASHIRVIPNGIDLRRFDASVKRGLQAPLPELSGRRAFVCVANMTHPVKAQEDLLDAVRHLAPDHPELAVLLVGDGARASALKLRAAQSGIQDRVFFLGHRTDVPAILSRAYAGVLCSHAEGMSNALVEYAAASRPTVATDVGGNREVVAQGERGLLVPPKHPQELAAAMRRLLLSPARAAEMGEAGRRFVEGELTTELLGLRHAELYREVAAA